MHFQRDLLTLSIIYYCGIYISTCIIYVHVHVHVHACKTVLGTYMYNVYVHIAIITFVHVCTCTCIIVHSTSEGKDWHGMIMKKHCSIGMED